ncbi:MAG: enoyl-CoA hydratase-related protein [Alphaproteobacteria bacterium]|jgi:2-(1,2-epoxy-1,2-dihydrophenyl)acetyl-CoA isomerase|nr:enoyl-CoA hydratase-related protein [Alphaproteobacteria bacterium]MDP6515604.1 enoyl-CoA hydratase-related protein [Alphaproteobacteria bacterium]
MSEPVLLSIDNAIATLTFNRPDRLNAIDYDMARGFRDAALRVEADAAVRAVMLRGAGKGFMAGGDVQLFHESADKGLKRLLIDLTHDLHAAIVALRRMPKPVVACVHGACAGGGFSTAMACDLVIAAEDAKFTMAYSLIGASPDGSSTFTLPRLVGFRRAMELALLSERFDSARAESLGLVNRTFPADRLEAEARTLMERLAGGPTLAFAKAKALFNRSLGSSLEAQLEAEAQSIAACADTADFIDGIAAFSEKRKPTFTGT